MSLLFAKHSSAFSIKKETTRLQKELTDTQKVLSAARQAITKLNDQVCILFSNNAVSQGRCFINLISTFSRSLSLYMCVSFEFSKITGVEV